MKILDVELKTGLSRANIRFYEKEGLIQIARAKNGYRDYSEEDVETLLKIKLLRQLRISIEEIKRLQKDEVRLQNVLKEQMRYLDAEVEELQHSHEICEHMYADGSSYQELNALKYLNELENKLKKQETTTMDTTASLENDVIIHPPHPWIRYFARSADYMLYMFVLYIVYYLIENHKPNFGMLFNLMMSTLSLGMMLIMEPLFLSKLGTTPGKWIFGISVTQEEGIKLSYKDAFWRTIKALWYGTGFYIPYLSFCWSGCYFILKLPLLAFIVYHLYSYWWCWDIYVKKKKPLPWDEEHDCGYHIRDTKVIRPIAYVFLMVALFFADLAITVYAELPRNKGNISLEEFAQNYNDYLEYYELYEYEDYYLNSKGRWRYKDIDSIPMYTVEVIGKQPNYLLYPAFTYVEENGILTEISLEHEATSTKKVEICGTYNSEISIAILSYACAQPGMGIREMNEIKKQVLTKLEDGDADFTYSIKNIAISCKIEDNIPDSYSVSFSIKNNHTAKS